LLWLTDGTENEFIHRVWINQKTRDTMAGRKGRRGWGRIRQLPNKGKRWQASYVWPPFGTRHNAPTTFSTRALAERWLAAERMLIERGEWTPPKTRIHREVLKAQTFGDYATRWIAERPLKESSRREYERMYRSFMADELGPIPLHALDAATVRAWFANLDTTPARKHKTYGRLASIVGTAVSDGLLSPNPCQLNVSKPPRQLKPAELTPAEVAQLASNIAPQRFSALVLIGAWCGLRIGELIGLQRGDVSEDYSRITVSRQVDHSGGCHVTSVKQNEQHTVVIPPHIRADIKHHLDTNVGAEPDALLFPGKGCHLSETSLRNSWHAAVKSIGRTNIRVHDLKHHAGTATARVGATLAENMARLGHRSVAASLVYQHSVAGRDEEIAAALSELAG
jgi:integrase